MSSSAYHDTSTKQKQCLGQRQCGGCTSHPACRVEGWNEAAGYGWKQHWLMTHSTVISCKCAVQGKIYAISTHAYQDNANQTSQHLLSFPPLSIILLLPHAALRSCGCCGWLWPAEHRGPWSLHRDPLQSCCQPCQFTLHYQSLSCAFAYGHTVQFFLFVFPLQSF